MLSVNVDWVEREIIRRALEKAKEVKKRAAGTMGIYLRKSASDSRCHGGKRAGLKLRWARMKRWNFEPGHTAAEFCVRHMMVSLVRGHFKNVHGSLLFDPEIPALSDVEAVIDARGLWSGEPNRDAHLRSADFLDVDRFPEIRFVSRSVRFTGPTEALVSGDLTVRGVTRLVELEVRFLGQWQTPWWEDGVDKGPKTRAGFVATTRINRQDFGVSWNGPLPKDGIVVGDEVLITLDVEAILED